MVLGQFTRGTLVRGLVAGLGALAGGALGATELVASPDRHGSAATDKAILTFALLIERLQAAFYAEALRSAALTGETLQFAQVVGKEERAHVKALEAALGSAARRSPRFKFGAAVSDHARFLATAISLEETGLGVYNGQAVNLTPKALAAAARIVWVEAQHAACRGAGARRQGARSRSPSTFRSRSAKAKKTFGRFIAS